MFFNVFLQVFNLASYTLTRCVIGQKPSLRRRDFGTILPYTVDNFTAIDKLDAFDALFHYFNEFNRSRGKIKRDFGSIGEFFHKLENRRHALFTCFHKHGIGCFKLLCRLDKISSVRPKIRAVSRHYERARASRKSAKKRTRFEVIHDVLTSVIVTRKHNIRVDSAVSYVLLQLFNISFHISPENFLFFLYYTTQKLLWQYLIYIRRYPFI